MRQWIRFPHVEGVSSRQAHADLPPMTYEREMGKSGFFGPATHMYHRHAPTAWTHWDGPLKPQAFDFSALHGTQNCPWMAPVVMSNAHTQIRWWSLNEHMSHLVRNGDGDQILFLHQGSGKLFCDFGHLTIHEGDYVMIPRGSMWRIDVQDPLSILMIEATNASYMLPDKGILGNHAIFDPAILDMPRIDEAFQAQQSETPWVVHIKRNNQITKVTYPFNPLDAVGWHGDLTVVRVNWRDIRPLMSHRYHLPPSAHSTFVSDRFIVCTFCPRPIESDSGALKVPFYHNNDDFDELIFYHKGQFFSRDNIHPGMVTLHPSGFPHGPHPKAFAIGAKAQRTETDEVAVMIDTRDALVVHDTLQTVEQVEYLHSWKGITQP